MGLFLCSTVWDLRIWSGITKEFSFWMNEWMKSCEISNIQYNRTELVWNQVKPPQNPLHSTKDECAAWCRSECSLESLQWMGTAFPCGSGRDNRIEWMWKQKALWIMNCWMRVESGLQSVPYGYQRAIQWVEMGSEKHIQSGKLPRLQLINRIKSWYKVTVSIICLGKKLAPFVVFGISSWF